MSKIINFEDLKQRKEEQDIANIADMINGNIIADACIEVTQEINAIMHYVTNSIKDSKRIGEILHGSISEADASYFHDLLSVQGENLQVIAKLFKDATNEPGTEERNLKRFYEPCSEPQDGRERIVDKIAQEYLNVLQESETVF